MLFLSVCLGLSQGGIGSAIEASRALIKASIFSGSVSVISAKILEVAIDDLPFFDDRFVESCHVHPAEDAGWVR